MVSQDKRMAEEKRSKTSTMHQFINLVQFGGKCFSQKYCLLYEDYNFENKRKHRSSA